MRYSDLSKDELLKLIKKQELDLKSKKYGLVWDDEKEPEQVVLDCRDNVPILRRIKGKEIKEPKNNSQEDNILIEGDNYHALTVLNYTHQEKIDVICIDPPYNTGNQDFKYNDCYVDKEDGYRHSKWLNFMEKRLRLAKNLLTKKGIILINIDENEFSQLKLLCDSIFYEKNIVGTFIWAGRSGKGGTANKISYQHEYVLCYANNIKECNILTDKRFGKSRTEMLTQWGQDYLRKNRPSMFFPVLYKENNLSMITKDEFKKIYVNNEFDDDYLENLKNKYEFKGFSFILPLIDEGYGRFRGGFETISSLIDKNQIIIKKNKHGLQLYRYYSADNVTETAIDSILNKFGTASTGTTELKLIFNGIKPFDTTKPLGLIKYLISISVANKKNALILDFFAGSGTTGQAVLEMNKIDNGNRKFILCTNNENNICTEITYPRVEKIINGYDFKGKDKTVLFEKKLTWADLNKKTESILEEVNNILEKNEDFYDKLKKEFKNNTLKIIGIKNIDGKKEGLGGNLQYFKTSLIQTTKNRDQTKINLTQKCTEMLCLKENIFNVEIKDDDFKIFSSNKKDKFLCVYHNFIDESFEIFINKLKKLKGEKIVYMFSLEDKIDKSLFKEIKNCRLEVIPQKILEVYKKLIKMNIPIKAETIFIDLDKAKKQVFEDKDKDTGAKTLRVVLEKLVQKVAQKNQINILSDKGKEIKSSILNDTLKNENIFSKLEWQENKTYFIIGNHASHGEYNEFDLIQVNKFYKHAQTLMNKFNI